MRLLVLSTLPSLMTSILSNSKIMHVCEQCTLAEIPLDPQLNECVCLLVYIGSHLLEHWDLLVLPQNSLSGVSREARLNLRKKVLKIKY